MNTLILKIQKRENESISDLLKKVNEISCRLHIDFEKGIITAKDVNNDAMDTIIEVIDKYFVIKSISVDNVADIEKARQRDDDEVVKFSDKNIEDLLNGKLIKTIVWAMSHGISSEEIQKYIWTMITEISYSGSTELRVENLSVGDIVQVNFGIHPKGEVSDSRGYAVVCDISSKDGSLFLVPIDKENNQTFIYAYLEMSKYVNPRRVDKIVGKLNPETLETLLYKVARAFDFRKKIK